MFELDGFIPKILLCGDREEFFAEIGERPCKVVGQVEFSGAFEGKPFDFLQDKKFLFEGKFHDDVELSEIFKTRDITYLIFNDSLVLLQVSQSLYVAGCSNAQLVTLREFKHLSADGLHDFQSERNFLELLKNRQIKNLLDVNGYFAKSQLLTKGFNDFTEIDGIFDGYLPPIKENIYSHVYKNFSECQFKHYDCALITANSAKDFDKIFLSLENCDAVVIFSRPNSEIKKHIGDTLFNFAKVDTLFHKTGNYLFCYPKKTADDFCAYVITHKKLPPEHIEKLPTGYKLIHSGRAISEDFGYMGDNTGDNISHLNPYLCEFVALYWIWKNNSHSVVGISHYRRFFTESKDLNFSHEKILSEERALEILKTYDIIVSPHHDDLAQFENLISGSGAKLAEIGRVVVEKYLSQTHPDYIPAFDFVMNSRMFYKCNMMVTRKNIFDAYCNWLFSFLVDSAKELWKIFNFQDIPTYQGRIVGFIAERMLTVWLIKNNLRIREMNVMLVNGI